jgi:voltage-gated sodium channel
VSDRTWQRRAAALSNSTRFSNLIVAVIVLNGAMIGYGTYVEDGSRAASVIDHADNVLLAVFTCELLIRVAGYGFNLKAFLRQPWNAFDTLAVGLCFVPGMGSNGTALRLVRLLRVARLLSMIPDVSTLIDGTRRALRPAAGLLILTTLMVYLYAVVGVSLFAAHSPERWGNVGEASLTLFGLLTLDGWGEILNEARESSVWAVVYILSFTVFGTFLVLNMVLGVVITSLDEAHAAARRDNADPSTPTAALQAVRDALEELEAQISLADLRTAAALSDGAKPADSS